MRRRDFVATTGAAWAALATPPAVLRVSRRRGVDPARLQAVLDGAAKALGVVGAQLAVFDGTTLHECATGMANRERGLAASTDTLFQIGSTTKVFNASMIMALVDRGVLDLDRPVRSYITDFALAEPEWAARITLRQLLSMSAGLDNGSYSDHGRGDDALDRYVAAMVSIPNIFEPGTGFGYSNAGSNVAGLAAQRATRRNWDALLRDHLLRPLRLERSATFPEELLFHSVSLGYRLGQQGAPPSRVPVWGLPRSMSPAGGTLCCSAGDLARLGRLFLDDGVAPDGTRVLSAAAVRVMHTPQVTLPARLTAERWCCGPYWKRWGGVELYGHSGTNSGGSSMLLWSPAKRMAIATIANVPNQGYPLANRIFDAVLPEMFGIAKPKQATPETVTRASFDPARYLGRFEAHGSILIFTAVDGKLMVQSTSPAARNEPIATELIPLGDDRFLPADPAMGGNRGWDVAFWGRDGAGRATHFLNGVFATRRTG